MAYRSRIPFSAKPNTNTPKCRNVVFATWTSVNHFFKRKWSCLIRVVHYYHRKSDLKWACYHYTASAGHYGVSHLGTINIDHAFMIALVERWCQETHTFHLPVYEASMTLQDFAVIMGLQIDGPYVFAPTLNEWRFTCYVLLDFFLLILVHLARRAYDSGFYEITSALDHQPTPRQYA